MKKPDPVVFTKEKLEDMRYRGEERMKRWADPPPVSERDGTWVITYCVENAMRMAGVSREDQSHFTLDDFHKALPLFREVFGKEVRVEQQWGECRGHLIILVFNEFMVKRFYPRKEGYFGDEKKERRS